MAFGRSMPEVPEAARRVLDALEGAGHEAWVVGGWVRDALLGDACHDVDVTTSAPWRKGAEVLRRAGMHVIETGTAYGTITAICGGVPIEVTTYRVEGAYSDRRHPDYVRFVTDVRADLARRDLTINAIAYHPQRGLLDPFGGVEDLECGVIRAVGDPYMRFSEDALRILRAVRFGLHLGFSVEERTQAALVGLAPTLSEIAPERIGSELSRIVCEGSAAHALMEQPEVMCAVIPELTSCLGFDQRSVYHVYDVYEHTAHVCAATEAFTGGLAPAGLRWAALLHDVAKPSTFSLDVEGHGHFFGHPKEGARVARKILKRLAIPSEVTRTACLLIRLHDEPMPATELAIRRLLARISRECPGQETQLAFQLFNLRRADAVSKCPSAAAWAAELDRYAALLRAEVARGPVFGVRQLAVTGSDVICALGMKPGPAVGMQLDMLLAAVMEGQVRNEREELLSWLVGK